MTTDRWTTYNGFSGAPGGERPLPDTGLRIERPDRPRPAARQFEPEEYQSPPKGQRPAARGVSRKMLLGGVAAAVGLGLLFGVVAKPDLVTGGQTREPMRPVTAAARTAPSPPMPIEVAAATPQPAAPPPTGKLEVLSPELAQAARTRSAVPAPRRAPPVLDTPAPAPAQPPAARELAPAPPRIAAAPPPAVRPSFNCRYASSRSEQMVCGDPELARLDRQLDRAFDRAVASGIPYRELRAEQDDWLAVREDAARRSPNAVESVYRQRIAELDDLAG